MSLTGIAGTSAADVGTAHTQYGNHHAAQKTLKVHAKHLKYVKKSINKHKRFFKKSKWSKKTFKSKKYNTRKVNKHYWYHGKKHRVYKHQYRHYGNHKKMQRVSAGSKIYTANSSSIKSLAHSLTNGAGSQYSKGARVFNWVKCNVKYKFYYNSKYRASGTLKYRAGNCADQAHLVVALARSSGLQARYVHAKARFRSGHVYGHYWAQIKANGKWITADTTSKRNSFGVARNWNSARIVGISSNI